MYDSKCILWVQVPVRTHSGGKGESGLSSINSFAFVFRLWMMNDEHAITSAFQWEYEIPARDGWRLRRAVVQWHTKSRVEVSTGSTESASNGIKDYQCE